ncbi:WD repeat-containing protein 46-like [Amphibalanus amphitrite]|uniref:WD repeat-containing protein 46-like n=1 Tax=Amphibalanus amphitrite TaxID=1232801 RepID=UPI001C91A635|nr:WD repeat-containing protein 46-like [Amphibalanus amphitrite]XP_043207128.1 WD repeat-containing protein 46-like [Amphibalanus amphitrite]XP_043207129.1 WD repeat-containing protein 46-like [Amphibalanus amphitrite]XP_043207130.1 WD repeat-containing protein 46-like [Amphibalanus amphitrite]XP_043207131.1 WD repeat-containing protein 46-like [Amphibalanus amphitrite]XP_043207132.1 WD repeat-containing protein 46-like [Amphibalanus amphitrite]XP_043207133.1 WD repeat-containing protein 46-
MESAKVLTKKERRQLRQQGRVPHKLKELSKATQVLKADRKKDNRTRQPWNRPKNADDGDPFPGPVPHSHSQLDKYDWGEGLDVSSLRPGPHQAHAWRRERLTEQALHEMATGEMLLQEEDGFLYADEGEDTADISQSDLRDAVDITSATKQFELRLRQFGPYCANYTRNGRQLVLGGSLGHVAALDWVTKQLMCEVSVGESVHDVKWLHNENMFAVAQKEWVFVYDSQGTELHCLKTLHRALKLEFLPYHFLLTCCTERGLLNWLDVSTGRIVTQTHTRMGRLGVMCQNPANAVLCLGHTRGVVSMWTPNVPEPVAKILCHPHPVQAVSVDHTGTYLATGSVDRTVKVWDLRTYGCLQSYRLGAGASHLQWSQKHLLAAAVGNTVEVYRDCITGTPDRPYLRHKMAGSVSGLQFCPYEDVLGCGHRNGFTSMLVPGAGQANFDAYESNPYQTKKQRREAEVKQLLEKIQPELITLDPVALGQVDTATLQEKVQAKEKLLFVKTPKIDYTPRKKTKGRSKDGKMAARKKGVRGLEQRKYIKEAKKASKALIEAEKGPAKAATATKKAVLDRFKKKSL